MKINTSNQPPFHVTFDYITLHDAMVRRVTNFCPSPAMRASLATVPIPGAWRIEESPSFGVISEQPMHGSWNSSIHIGKECMANCVSCVFDGDAKQAWKGMRRKLEEDNQFAQSPPGYIHRFRAISPEVGFIAVSPDRNLLKYPNEWGAFTMLQYLLYWKFKQRTAEISSSGKLMI